MSVLAANVAQMVGRNSDHMDWGDDGSWWMVGMMTIFGLAIIGVLVWVVVMISRSHGSTPSVQLPVAAQSSQSTAREILDQRFARGEIDAAEYAERKQLLG